MAVWTMASARRRCFSPSASPVSNAVQTSRTPTPPYAGAKKKSRIPRMLDDRLFDAFITHPRLGWTPSGRTIVDDCCVRLYEKRARAQLQMDGLAAGGEEDADPRATELSEGRSQPTKGKRRLVRCGTCPACRTPDCDECKNCLDKPRNGGCNVRKKMCSKRVCSHMHTLRTVRRDEEK